MSANEETKAGADAMTEEAAYYAMMPDPVAAIEAADRALIASRTPPPAERMAAELRAVAMANFSDEDTVEMVNWIDDAGPQLLRAADEIDRLQALQPDYTREDYNRLHRAYCDEHERSEAAEAKLAEMRKALEWYADQFCEAGRYAEICGHHPDCSGCLARNTLATTPASTEEPAK